MIFFELLPFENFEILRRNFANAFISKSIKAKDLKPVLADKE